MSTYFRGTGMLAQGWHVFCNCRFPARRGQQCQSAHCCKPKYLSPISGAAVVTVGNCSQKLSRVLPLLWHFPLHHTKLATSVFGHPESFITLPSWYNLWKRMKSNKNNSGPSCEWITAHSLSMLSPNHTDGVEGLPHWHAKTSSWVRSPTDLTNVLGKGVFERWKRRLPGYSHET